MAAVDAKRSDVLAITGLTCDSRDAAPGFLFAALPGEKVDGRSFIDQALKKGAGAVLAPTGTTLPMGHGDVALITDDNPRHLYALMASRYFARQPATVAAVTGTNGKTSVATFTRQLWAALGHRAGSIGTLGIEAPGVDLDSSLTTPDPVEMHRNLAALKDAGIEHLALEASSHGLAQHRLDGVRVTRAAFTNLTHDHLDYHGDMDGYLAAKLRLFTDLLDGDGIAIVNADSDYASAVIDACTARGVDVRTYGNAGQFVRIASVTAQPEGQQVCFEADGKTLDVMLPLVGRFQVSNVACALALVLADGGDMNALAGALEALKGAPGRMEYIGETGNGATVYVDYAHTPDALAHALDSLRPHTRGWLHVVFGCGGDRDKGKRPLMGREACDRADTVIVTDDNPRGENADDIRAAIMDGCANKDALIAVPGRSAAIHAAVQSLKEGDTLLVAGKGHEQGQIIGDRVWPFDDAEQCRKALAGGIT